MPDDRWSSWQAEQAGTNHGPSIGSTLLLFAVVALVLLALLATPPTAAERGGRQVAPPPCAQHFPPTCEAR
jgi:hypothetical protein